MALRERLCSAASSVAFSTMSAGRLMEICICPSPLWCEYVRFPFIIKQYTRITGCSLMKKKLEKMNITA